MRVTEDRYAKERQRMEIAMRLIQLEARTCTIQACTGLSEDRIRKLFNAYVHPGAHGTVRRRRGKSPRQIACFTEGMSAQFSSSLLAGVFVGCDLLNKRAAAVTLSVETAAVLCDAYEHYATLDPTKKFSFEHAVFLFQSLWSETELILDCCSGCGALYVAERWFRRGKRCPFCRYSACLHAVTLTATCSEDRERLSVSVKRKRNDMSPRRI